MNAIQPITSVSGTLATRAMVVNLTISQWSAHRLDRKATEEVTSSHGAKKDAGNFNKHLLPRDALAGINKVVSSTRNDFLERTLPWLNDGSRIMNANAFLAHSAWFRGQKDKFFDEVEKFVVAYPGYQLEAQRDLGSLYLQSDYPSVQEVRRKFGMEMTVLPVQTSDDWRVEMSDAQSEAIRAQIEQTITSAADAAVKNVFSRVHEVMSRMVERLGAYKPGDAKNKAEGVFRDSLVENVRDLVAIMPQLNITGNPDLDRLADDLKRISKFDADTLRNSDSAREITKAEAQKVIDTLGGMFQ